MRYLKALLMLLMLPSLVSAQTAVLGPAANPPDATLYDYRNTIRVQEEFLGAASSTGNIGSLGWGVSFGTTSQTAPSADRYGLITRDTSAASGTAASLVLNGNQTVLLGTTQHKLTFIAKLNQVDANTAVWYGAAVTSGSVPNDGIWIEKRDADTNWFCVTRASSSQTRTDSGVAVTTNYTTFTYERTSANVVFSINGNRVCTHTATIPTAALDPATVIINSAAASKTHTIDYFELIVSGMAR